MTINAGNNDSDDGNDDEADMDNDSVSFLMAPPPPLPTAEANEKDSATVEELRQTIVLREQQVKSATVSEIHQ